MSRPARARIMTALLALLFCCGLLVGCGDENGQREEHSGPGRTTEQIADEATARIKAPIDQARQAADLAGERAREMEDRIQEQ